MPASNRDVRTIEEKIKARALSLGFLSCGITTPEPMQSFSRYQQWLDKKQHGDMKYLSTPYHMESRRDVHTLMPDVRSIICLGYQYPLHPVTSLQQPYKALVAGYAAGIDYHLSLPVLMDTLITFIQSIAGVEVHPQRFTDSAPILERELAHRAGLGWIGRNTFVISPEFGSSFLLAEILLDLPLVPDSSYSLDRCGTCQRCIKACPTGCINHDRTIDASRCISYHTIENKKNIPVEISDKIGKWLFGCDVCQMVCPWNQKSHNSYAGIPALSFTIQDLIDTLTFSPEDFTTHFDQSPILRVKWQGFLRNALIVLSSSDPEIALSALHSFIRTNRDENLIAHAKWSLRNLINKPPV